MNTKSKISRRSFLKFAGAMPLVSFVPSILSESASAAISCPAGNAKSLVCVFLLGGADSFSMVVPGGDKYQQYKSIRGDLAVSDVAGGTAAPGSPIISAFDDSQGEFGFNGLLSGMHDLYQQQNLAVVSNVGNLVEPTSKAAYDAKTARLPESLFAHDAQQKLWQTGQEKLSNNNGWGGSILEQIVNCNVSSNLSGSFSLNGSNTWLNNLLNPYLSLNPNTPLPLLKGYDQHNSTNVKSTMNDLLTHFRNKSSAPFENQLAASLASTKITTQELAGIMTDSQYEVPMTYDSGNGLAAQLETVARLIAAREDMNMGRQVYFVSMGGWDTHGFQNLRLQTLLTQLDEALSGFQQAIDSIGKADSVTTFTASDFGRTLTTNGDGTDHGWGGHAFVMGGGVQGGKVYGDFPSFTAIDNPDEAGDGGTSFTGRVIPTTSVAQYGATLSQWMGLPLQSCEEVFPELVNFSNKNLGFMT